MDQSRTTGQRGLVLLPGPQHEAFAHVSLHQEVGEAFDRVVQVDTLACSRKDSSLAYQCIYKDRRGESP